jgi:sec-independent protein translocase protein TatB
MIRKARQMAAEFQTQADELVREANLHEVRESLNEIRNFNIKDQIEKAVDADGSLRKTFSEDPLRDWSATSSSGPPPATPSGLPATDTPASGAGDSPAAEAPAFVPPSTEPGPVLAEPPDPPAFIPPGIPSGIPPDAMPAGKPPSAGPAGTTQNA